MRRNPRDRSCRPIRNREFGRGEMLYLAGQAGGAWRVVSGSVRLDREETEGPAFAGLSLVGDVIGAETLLFGAYAYSAYALSNCVVEPWGEPSETESLGESLLRLLAAAERRMADILAIRSGRADERVGGLLAMLSSGGGQSAVSFDLPRLRDIAEITGLTVETVSRTIHSLDETGAVEIEGRRKDRRVGPFGGSCRGGC